MYKIPLLFLISIGIFSKSKPVNLEVDFCDNQISINNISYTKESPIDSLNLIIGKSNNSHEEDFHRCTKGECGMNYWIFDCNEKIYEYKSKKIEISIDKKSSYFKSITFLMNKNSKKSFQGTIKIDDNIITSTLTQSEAKELFKDWSFSSDSSYMYNEIDYMDKIPTPILFFNKRNKIISSVVFNMGVVCLGVFSKECN